MRSSIILFLMICCIPIVSSEDIFAKETQVVLTGETDLETTLGRTDRGRQVVARAQIVWEAGRLLEKGFYEQAIAKYMEALDERYIAKPNDKNAALSGLTNAKQLLGLYEEAYALNEEKITINAYRDKVELSDIDWWQLRSEELLVLIKYKKLNDQAAVRGFVLKRGVIIKKLFSAREIAHDEKGHFEKSLYLYELIQDYDSALKLCDEYLAMKKVKKDKKFKGEVEDLRQTILEARETKEKNKIFKKLNEYGFYNWL